MNQRIVHLALVVKEYDEAIDFYTRQLGFELMEDTALSETKRWVLIKPKGEGACALLLAKAGDEQQRSAVGNQTGGRVFLFLHTDDFWRDYERMKQNNIEFVREASEQEHGLVAVFKDLYGNLWDLIQPKAS
ncbi:MAG TPA: VOC family protein [Flavisolibacter sp.]|jgi:catechol 2,3-dioxygenase-like lactoylglutathione lyase family enzyme|nr:VOC family protein [Flavisolibacter sp.]